MTLFPKASGKQVLEYSPDDTFKAVISVLEESDEFFITESDHFSRTISFHSGVSWRSWGESLLITIAGTANGMSEISINSATMFGIIDWGKNKENLNIILNLTADELRNYHRITQDGVVVPEDISS
jgi:hypothetical protein